MITFIIGAACFLLIFLAFEIRHEQVTEELSKLKIAISKMDDEVMILKAQIKQKKDIHEAHNPTIY